MTGFGRGTAVLGAYTVTVELASVNRKQLDVSVWIPREWQCFESVALSVLRGKLARGAVKCSVTIAAGSTVGDPLADSVANLRETARRLGIPAALTVADLLTLMSGDIRTPIPQPDADAEAALRAALSAAADCLSAMREHEGALLEKDIRERLTHLRDMLKSIQYFSRDLPAIYRKNLQQRFREILPQHPELPADILAREAALFAERCDIAEEITRLHAHFDHADAVLKDGSPCGRALDFLCQEFFREINTVGSKCASDEISYHVIEFKTLLETVREQVQNLE